MNVINDASKLVRIAAPEAGAALGLGRAAGQLADDLPRALHALDDVKVLGGVAQLANKTPLGAGDAVAALAVEPHRLNALRLAENQGARVINRASAIEHVQSKGAMSSVLDAAGVHNAASGTMTRTADEVRAAVDSFGGKAHITGGFSQSRIAPKIGEGHAAVDSALGTPRPVNISTADDLEKFIASNVDRERAFLVQAPITGQAGETTVVGDKVVHASGKAGSLKTLAPAEQEQAVKAVKAFGLDTGAVTVERGTDGAMRVRDVLPAPVGEAARSQVQAMAKDSSALLDAVGSATPSTAIADSVKAARPSIGVANMGRVPGKNISRVMAEVEKQGANPVFMPLKQTSVAADGTTVLFAGKPAPKMDAIITRTGAIIDDAGIGTLNELEKSGMPIINSGNAMALVRDKNIQAKTLIDAGIAHPLSTTVESPADIQKAVDLIGDSMVLKNPASSEGRGVMFLEGRDTIDGVAQMFHKRTAGSTLVAESMRPGELTPTRMVLNGREDAERAVRELGGATLQRDAALGVDQLQMAHPVKLLDPATGASTTVKRPLSLLTVTDAFHDAKPGATLKAEHWFKESAGVDTRIHVMRGADGEYRVIKAMSRRAQPSIYGEARSNMTLGGSAEAVKTTLQEDEMAIGAARAFDLDIAGVDVLATHKGPHVLEVNGAPGLDIEAAAGAVADKWVDLAMSKARGGATAGVNAGVPS